MAFINDVDNLTSQLRNSLLQIQDDLSHEIALIKKAKNHPPSPFKKIDFNMSLLKGKDSGMRLNLYKFQTISLDASANLGARSRMMKDISASQTSFASKRRKSDPICSSNQALQIQLPHDNDSNTRSLNAQLSSSLGKIGIEMISSQVKTSEEIYGVFGGVESVIKEDDVASVLKSTLQDDDDDILDLADLGDELIYEIPTNFTEFSVSVESKLSTPISAKTPRKLTRKQEQHSAGKFLFDAHKFGADPQEPVIMELNNNETAPEVSGVSKTNSMDELSPPTPIPQEPYKFDKVIVEHDTSKKVIPISFLTAMMERKTELNNPLAAQYAGYGTKMESDGMKIKIYLPFSDNPEKPLYISVKADASVDNVIGYCLFEYINEKFTPILNSKILNVSFWSIRIVEDDGEVDEDFPALERSRRIGKYAFDQFALINLKPLQDNPIYQSKPNLAEMPDVSSATPSVFLKIHLYSTLEIKQTTIMQMPLNISMQEVFNRICAKRGYDQKDFILKMADVKTDVPLDKTLQQVDCIEFCVLKRSSGGAGDIFLRPQDELDAKEDKFDFSSEDFRTMFKQYNVVSNKLMGRQERVLTVDGEYIHLDGAESKGFFDRGKSAVSHNFKDVISCVQPKTTTSTFRLTVQRADGNKIYEFDAGTPRLALEICSRVAYILSHLVT